VLLPAHKLTNAHLPLKTSPPEIFFASSPLQFNPTFLYKKVLAGFSLGKPAGRFFCVMMFGLCLWFELSAMAWSIYVD